jgi:hypothetical protein
MEWVYRGLFERLLCEFIQMARLDSNDEITTGNVLNLASNPPLTPTCVLRSVRVRVVRGHGSQQKSKISQTPDHHPYLRIYDASMRSPQLWRTGHERCGD